ncbi:LysM domain-containing protein [Dioscorea alata]|uniref:LysM domain-containing protein n=1 Tax=Dioscorea alata TaxID=55571 RepID=A0ACB7WD51_DIOAL|nr:LysM domain-containing protein [Dioscorea alata]
MASIENMIARFCALLFLMITMLLLLSSEVDVQILRMKSINNEGWSGSGNQYPCDEIYIVGEGETLHSISAKCGDPFILEENPHIQDSDDVFPGLVIKITRPLF